METHEQNPPNGRSTIESGSPTIGKRVDQVTDTAQQAWTRTRDAFSDLRETLDIDGRVQRNPYGTLAAALGIGYVLGGGIFTPLTSRILGIGMRIGLRVALLPLLKDELSGLADTLGAQSGEGEASRSRRTTKANVNKGRQP